MSGRLTQLENARLEGFGNEPSVPARSPVSTPVRGPTAEATDSISFAVNAPAAAPVPTIHRNALFEGSPSTSNSTQPVPWPSIPAPSLREMLREELSTIKADLFAANATPNSGPTNPPRQTSPSVVEEPALRLPGGFKLADLPRFDGKVHVSNAQLVKSWLQQVKARFDLFNMSLDEPRYLQLAASHLDGLVHTWWMNLCAVAGPSGGFDSWKDFCDGFSLQFTPPDASKYCFRKLMRLDQGRTDVTTYAATFRSLLDQLPKIDLWWQLRMFYEGLHPSTAAMVETAEPASLTKAIELAIKFEAGRKDVVQQASRAKQGWTEVRNRSGGFSPQRGGHVPPAGAKPVAVKTRFNALDVDLSGTDVGSGTDVPEDLESDFSGYSAEAGLHALKASGNSHNHKKKSRLRKHPHGATSAVQPSQPAQKNSVGPQQGK